MSTNVTSNSFLPNPETFFQNTGFAGIPQMPTLNGGLPTELIGAPYPNIGDGIALQDPATSRNGANNSFLLNPETLFQNTGFTGIPQMPTFNGGLPTELIGASEPNTEDEMLSCLAKGNKWAEEYQSVLAKGDGNGAVHRIIQGLKEGILTKEEAIQLAKQVQEQANCAGGGKINGEMRGALKEALGTDVDHISKGKTRVQMGWEKFINGLLSIFGL